jgi:hypothetical protein
MYLLLTPQEDRRSRDVARCGVGLAGKLVYFARVVARAPYERVGPSNKGMKLTRPGPRTVEGA